MGGKSSSNSASNTYNTTKNTSGSVGLDGDNHGTVISGVSESNITITDHGAVNSALKAMSDVSKGAFDLGSDAIEANEAVTRDVISSNERVSMGVIGLSNDIVGDALSQSERSTEMALDVARNISRDTGSATNQDAVKYMALATVAVAVSMALRK